MAVGFSSYDIARSGLYVSERGLAVTGHNLSNVDTVGYTRQQAMIETSHYITDYGKNGKMFQYGLGADIQETRQIRHTFLDNIYRQENTSLGYWETRSKTFQDVEAILNDPMGDGLQEVMNQFWDSWQELTKTPESLTTRAVVRQRGQALTYYFNHIGTQLDKLQADLNSEIKVRVDEVNDITGQLAKLNYKIATEEIGGDAANDYRDQRNVLLDRLSKLCDADVLEMQDGQVDVTLGGYYLVSKGTSTNLYVEANPKHGEYFYPMLQGTNTEVNIKGGILKGLLESRGEVPGIKGSYENGTPKEKVDITFAIDTSYGSGTGADEYLSKLRDTIDEYVAGLKNSGVDFNIRFVSMGAGSTVFNGAVYDRDNIDAFINDTAGLDALCSEAGDTDASFGALISTLEGLNAGGGFREDTAKAVFVLTNESVDGNDGTPAEAADYINRLNAIGMRTSVVTGKDYFSSGVGNTTSGKPEMGWNTIAAGTGGTVFDIGAENFNNVVEFVNADTRRAVNANSGNIPISKNIVSDVKIKLNAMLSGLCKEINYLQKSGFTLDGQPGVNFFEPIDDLFPIQMGNIKLSDALLSDNGLNNIVTSDDKDAKGGNNIARLIANLRDQDIMTDVTGVVSIDEYYRAVILDIGNGGSEALKTAENQTTIVQSVDQQRSSISGVSMDEEMANMMKFKFAYDASSRVLNIIDSMVENVIMSMGKVGR